MTCRRILITIPGLMVRVGQIVAMMSVPVAATFPKMEFPIVTSYCGSRQVHRRFDGAVLERYHVWFAFSVILMFVALAWRQRFVQDDAFISFRYAENLFNGHGLVWNPGERVEGYSNFLWTLLITAGMFFGVEPIGWSEILGVISFAGSMSFTYAIIRRCSASSFAALIAIAILGWNYSFRSFATGGLETQLQTCLFTATGYVLLTIISRPIATPGRLFTFSFLGSLAILTRMDSLLICVLFDTALAVRLLRSGQSQRTMLTGIGALALPKLLVLLPWVLWRVSYYGDIFPNTFYLKIPGSGDRYLSQGLVYMGRFAVSYWTVPLLLAGIFAVKKFFRNQDLFLQLIGVALILWTAYLVFIGGDFMEFRMIVPILPFMAVVTVWLLREGVSWKPVKVILMAILLAGSFYHEHQFEYRLAEGIEPVGQLKAHLQREDENWIGIGRMLDSLFRHDRSVTIATTAAGAIPFYAKLPSIDMLGINEPWVGRFGVPAGDIPGHQRISPLSYLLRRKVNLVFSHPLVLPVGEPVRYHLYVPIDCAPGDNSPRIVELPIGGGYKVVIWYLTPHPAIEELIRSHRCVSYPLAMR